MGYKTDLFVSEKIYLILWEPIKGKTERYVSFNEKEYREKLYKIYNSNPHSVFSQQISCNGKSTYIHVWIYY